MDGTLIDSADYHWRSWRDALAREGRSVTYKEFTATFGQRNDAILRQLLDPNISDAEIARIGGAKEQDYRSIVREEGISFLAGARDWLERLHVAGWRQAVASSAPPANIITILEVLDASHFFDALVSGEEVVNGKPAPDIFLRAAEKCGVAPQRCIVVEDAPAGVEGGRRGSMRTIGVLTSHEHLEADIVVRSLADLPADAFDSLVS
jgi:beta-phosphoglucomutase